MRRLSRLAPAPREAAKSSWRTGSNTTPCSTIPWRANGDGHREVGIPAQVVSGAVERVDDPFEFGSRAVAGLFGQNGVTGIGAPDYVDDQGFRAPVHFAHQILTALAPLVFHLQQVDAIEVPYNHVPCDSGGANRDVQ